MDTDGKRKVIIVTDGDSCAKEAVEAATRNIGGRCISKSAGNPTVVTGQEILRYIKAADHDPIVVMADDKGNTGMGNGEVVMKHLLASSEIEVIGIIAVASNTRDVKGIMVDYSIDNNGNIVSKGVDKNGNIKKTRRMKGDTVDMLNKVSHPIIIGVGDPGKMDGCDNILNGAPIITRAMQTIIDMSKRNTEK